MNLDVSLGQYYEGNSLLHRLDPRFKLLITIVAIAAIFVAKNVLAFGFLFVVTLALIAVSKIPFRIVLRGMRSLVFILIFTAFINIFWLKGETLLVEFGFVHIYLEGVINAALIFARIVILIALTGVLLTYTTTPLGLTDGLERVLSPLAKLRVPVHDFSMMMTIALRFIPTLVEETQKIMNAQTARGASFSEGNFLKRAKALIPIIIPLFVSSIRRATELADAMECRCYIGGEGRTKMNVLRCGARDVAAALVSIAVLAAVILINRYAPGYTLSL